MPTYEYACKTCGEHLEVVQSFKDDALTVCPACGGELRKVFGSIGIAFKGSGFYRTDSRPAGRRDGGGDKAAETKADAKTDTKTDTKTEKKAEKKPADTGTTASQTA